MLDLTSKIYLFMNKIGSRIFKPVNYTGMQALQTALLLSSLLLYFIAPVSFSLPFCIECAVIFGVSAFFVIRMSYRQSESFINFDLLFTIPFFYTNYVYCLFLYNDNPYFSLFRLDFNEGYICKGAALATVAYCCYALGRSFYIRPKTPKSLILQQSNYSGAITFFYLISIYFILFSLIPNLGKSYDEGSASYGIGDYIMPFVIILMYYKLAVNIFVHKQTTLIGTYRTDKFFYLLVATILLLFAAEGARTFIMRIGIFALFLYDFCCRRIKPREAIIILIAGFAFMALIGLTRSGDSSSGEMISDNPVIQAGQDLIINNRSEYVLMEYADKNGYTYGKTALMNLFSVIPFMQNIIFSNTSLSVWNTNSAYIVTNLYYADRNEDKIIGLGTNLVGDVYIMFGLIGLVIIMILLGRLISSLTERIKIGDFVAIMIYGMMICNAVYYTRSTILTPLRETCWLLFIYYITTLHSRTARKPISV